MAHGNVPIKYCRHCGRLIHLNAADCPYCGRNTIRHAQDRLCPFCREAIKPRAIKCRHCGEFLDGRERAPRREPAAEQPVVIQIENAIIANTGADGGPELVRPDGQVIDVQQVPGRALPHKSGNHAPAPAQLPPKRRRALPAAKDSDAPPGEAPDLPPAGNVPAVIDAEVTSVKASDSSAAPPARRTQEDAAPPARRKRRKRKKHPGRQKKPPEPPEDPPRRRPEQPAPPVQYPCPGCKQMVLEDDSFCENCGRDLSLRPDEHEFPEGRLSAVADYALALGLASPVVIPLGLPWSLSVGACAVVLGCWALVRIHASRGDLAGTGRAIVGLAAGLFWLLAIGILTG